MGTTKDIREAVEAELEFDPLVDDADIHVVNIKGLLVMFELVSTSLIMPGVLAIPYIRG